MPHIYKRKLINKEGKTIANYETENYHDKLISIDISDKLEKRYEVCVYNDSTDEEFLGSEIFSEYPNEEQILYTIFKYGHYNCKTYVNDFYKVVDKYD